MQILTRLPSRQEQTGHFRNELKYLCTETQLQMIQARIRLLCPPDMHADRDGIYHIRSIYFDDPQNRCYYENENGIDPREKFRIRIYNASDRKITLECKRKERSMTQKRSCPLSMEQYRKIMDGSLSEQDLDSGLLREFYVHMTRDKFRPKVIAAYDRTPFVYSAGNVRITFDRNIGSSTDFDHFFDPQLSMRPILPVGKHVLEVKFDGFLPNFLYSAMDLGSLQQTAFSKFYLCRKFTTIRRETYERTGYLEKFLSEPV